MLHPTLFLGARSALSYDLGVRLGTKIPQRTETTRTKKDKATGGRTTISITGRRLRGVTPVLVPSESDDLPSTVILPEQFFLLAQHSPTHWSGTRRLLLAVLQEAIDCWFRHRHARSGRGRQLFREAHAWFWAQDRHWLFAFERICEHLQLDPDYIRCGLTHWQSSQPGRHPALPGMDPEPDPQHFSLVDT